jgi:hypothetical protein
VLITLCEFHVPITHFRDEFKLIRGLPDELVIVGVDHDGVTQRQVAHYLSNTVMLTVVNVTQNISEVHLECIFFGKG